MARSKLDPQSILDGDVSPAAEIARTKLAQRALAVCAVNLTDGKLWNDMAVNPIKGKKLTNMRSSGNDENIILTPPHKISLENGLEVMQEDEYLEVNPKNIRLRKRFRTENDRIKAARSGQ